ncbi:hypothetical protein DV735_g915, partial [Chaetothyriales sp. CBS 134920]
MNETVGRRVRYIAVASAIAGTLLSNSEWGSDTIPKSSMPPNQDEAALCTSRRTTERGTRSPRQSPRQSTAPTPLSTESGTEADDEKDSILKRLPAPPPRLHKGLRGSTPPKTLTPARSPLPTPPAVFQQELTGFFDTIKHHKPKDRSESEDRRRVREYVQRKTRELVRRSAETALLAAITALTLFSAQPAVIQPWSLELITALCLPLLLYLAYPVRKTALAYASGSKTPLQAAWLGFHVPSRFDPGPLLYPVVLPVIIAVSLLHSRPAYLPVNLVCALSTIPDRVTAIWHRPALLWHLQWIITILPLHIPRMQLFSAQWTPIGLKWMDTATPEDCVLVFPLHQNLKAVLGFLTTTSLDPCELELLTTALVNLWLFASSPQAHILRAIIWVGGLSVLITCRHLLSWEVTLARIPKWRFAKKPQAVSLSQQLKQTFQAWSSSKTQPAPDSSDDEVDERVSARPPPRLNLANRSRTEAGPLPVAISANGSADYHTELRQRGRRSTFSAPDPKTVYPSPGGRGLRQLRSLKSSSFLSLTAQQAAVRKYAFAGLVYALILTILLGPVWYYVATRALSGAEPLGWALGYAFGNVPYFRGLVYDWHLDHWIKLPAMPDYHPLGRGAGAAIAALLTTAYMGNIRLLITFYCLAILAIGIATVLSLTAYVQVDTRRKVFHGVMVAMLLPTIFPDPLLESVLTAANDNVVVPVVLWLL